jgi:uncharacterized SAM-binding protein YcdF (DUF218 family)
MYERFLNSFTEFVFVRHRPEKADVIFLPGNGFPQMAERAAALWKEGFAPLILPSGKYSVLEGKFSGVLAEKEKYGGDYSTEWEFLREVLRKNGVAEEAILREDQATYTYENAVFSRRLLDARGERIRKGIICCQEYHARRCLLYYQLLFPEAELLVCPSDTGINRHNWMESGEGIDLVLGEIERCGGQFHKILRDI